MMYNNRYLPENFEQCRLEETDSRASQMDCPPFKMAVKNHERAYCGLFTFKQLVACLEYPWPCTVYTLFT